MPEVSLSTRPISSSAITGSAAQQTPAPRQLDTPEEVVAPEQKQPGADRLALIARKEQAFRAQQLALKAEREQWEAGKGARETERQELERLREREKRLAEDPYSVMLDLGMTADQVAAKLLDQPNPADQRVILLEKKIAELEAAQGKTTTKFDEVSEMQRQASIKQIGADVKMMVDSDPEFETIKEMGAQQAVVDLIIKTFDGDPELGIEPGELLSNEEAAKLVEEHLVETALRQAQLKKVQAKLNRPAEQQKQELPVKQPAQQRTLSNSMSPSTNKSLTWAERRARAVAVAEGKTPN